MKPFVKFAIVLGGYGVALWAARVAVALNMARVRALPNPPSDGMSAFGDLVLFVFVFGVVALLPTGAAIFFLLARNKHQSLS